MSGKHPVVSWRELLNALEKLGYKKVSLKGSHIKLKFENKSVVILPKHKEISIGVLKQIIREVIHKFDISEDDFLKMLK